MSATQRISIAISPEDQKKIAEAAKLVGIPKSEYCRKKILGTATATLSDTVTIEDHIDRLGRNLLAEMQAQRKSFVESVSQLTEQQDRANRIIQKNMETMSNMLDEMTKSLDGIANASAEMREQNAQDSQDIGRLLLGWKTDLAKLHKVVTDLYAFYNNQE